MHPRPLLCGGYSGPVVLLCVSRDPTGVYAVGAQLKVEDGASCALRLKVQLCVGSSCSCACWWFGVRGGLCQFGDASRRESSGETHSRANHTDEKRGRRETNSKCVFRTLKAKLCQSVPTPAHPCRSGPLHTILCHPCRSGHSMPFHAQLCQSEQSVPSHAKRCPSEQSVPIRAKRCQSEQSVPSDANPSNPCHSVPFQAEPPFQPACQPQPPTSWHEIGGLKHEKLLKLGKPLPRVMPSNTSLRAK